MPLLYFSFPVYPCLMFTYVLLLICVCEIDDKNRNYVDIPLVQEANRHEKFILCRWVSLIGEERMR